MVAAMGIKKQKPVALLIDGDIVCYRSAACIEKRTVMVTHLKSGRAKEFDTRTEFKEFLKSKDFVYKADEYNFRDIQTPEDVSHATYIVKNLVNTLKQKFNPDVVRVLIGGKDNFRDSLPLPKQYKSNRKDMLRPLCLQEVRDYMTRVHGAELINGHETDDALTYFGYEYLNKGYDAIVVTIDKDALAYSGLKVYDYTKTDSEPLLISELGELYLNSKAEVKGNGFLWYCLQMLIGDATDFYRPFEVAGTKYGEKTAYKALKDCKDKKTALEAVVSEYKRIYPSTVTYKSWDGLEITTDWLGMLSLYHKCVRMKATKDDTLNFKDFAKQHGVEL